jgi:hypothetical protein
MGTHVLHVLHIQNTSCMVSALLHRAALVVWSTINTTVYLLCSPSTQLQADHSHTADASLLAFGS